MACHTYPTEDTTLSVPAGTTKRFINVLLLYSNRKQTLEKVVNGIKKHGREIVTAVALPFIFINSGDGGSLRAYNISSVVIGSSMDAKHIEGAYEDYTNNGTDSIYNESSPNPLHVYSEIEDSSPYHEDRLSRDARSLNSVTPFNIRLKAKQFISYADNSLRFRVTDANGFSHRNIIAYDINEPNNIHEIPKNGDTLEVPLAPLFNQPEGIYANWVVEMPRMVEGDINEDGICDLKDYAILASEWYQTSSPTENGGNFKISDLNIDRVTDESDLAILCSSWLVSE